MNDSESNFLLGVLGGMGPLATVDFVEKIVLSTKATCDQQHVPMLISNDPVIPDRSTSIMAQGLSPYPAMFQRAKRLKNAGVSLMVIPCNTAHAWYEQLSHDIDVAMLHIVACVLNELEKYHNGKVKVGLLATEGTLTAGVYSKYQDYPYANQIEWVLPDRDLLNDYVMPAIHAVKSGDLVKGRQDLECAAQTLCEQGAQVIVMACTEIPIVLTQENVNVPLLDATQTLVNAVLAKFLERSNLHVV